MTVATIKYYIREGLLPAGTTISATQAEYDSAHVDRLRLIRALVDVGRLSITTVRELLATLDGPADDAPIEPDHAPTGPDGPAANGKTDGPAAGLVSGASAGTKDSASAAKRDSASAGTRDGGTAGQEGDSAAGRQDDTAEAERDRATAAKRDGATADWIASDRVAQAVATAHEALSPPPAAGSPPPERALAAMATLGWQVDPDSAALRVLEAALAGLDAVQLVPGEATLRTYAAAALSVAEIDVTGVPSASPAETVRYVVIGTVMYEPVLIALRRLAQQHVFRQLGSRSPE
jgi:DNA-binding transcriptional MerR regulator